MPSTIHPCYEGKQALVRDMIVQADELTAKAVSSRGTGASDASAACFIPPVNPAIKRHREYGRQMEQ